MRIGIIGAGNLGSAIAHLTSKNLTKNSIITLSDTKHVDIFRKFPRVKNLEAIEKSDILFLCCKPNDIPNVIEEINKAKQKRNQLLISCIAGVPMNFIDKNLRNIYPLIRMMTNLPISYQKGSITYIYNSYMTEELKSRFEEIVNGPILLKVNSEHLIDVSTVLTGAMPAFTSFIAEEMIEFGIRQGFSYKESRDLYIATIVGTMEMLKDHRVDDIMDAVSSPNGITEKGLNYLETSGIRSILFSTLHKSYQAISSLSNSRKD